MDHHVEEELETIDSSRECPFGGLKSCVDCHTTKTPLWRGGPSGPKSLCNACGIRYRKKRRELLGLKDGVEKEKRRDNNSKMSILRLLDFGTDLLLKQRSLHRLKRRRRLGEEEEAAVLLMALSSGLTYA